MSNDVKRIHFYHKKLKKKVDYVPQPFFTPITCIVKKCNMNAVLYLYILGYKYMKLTTIMFI
jgi:hypothetical protein